MKPVSEVASNGSTYVQQPANQAPLQQGQGQLAVVEQDRKELQSLRAGLEGPGGAPGEIQTDSPPVVVAHEASFSALALPRELWTRILELLGPVGRLRAMPTCRWFYSIGRNCEIPDAEQKGRCEEILGSLHHEWKNRGGSRIDLFTVDYGRKLEHLANKLSCLEFPVSGGMESSVVAALKRAKGWKHLGLELQYRMPTINSSCFKELDSWMESGQRKASLHLILHTMETVGLDFLLYEAKALTLEGLNMLDVRNEDVPRLCSLLEADTRLETVRIASEDRNFDLAVIVAAMKKGIPALVELNLDEVVTDFKMLTQMLELKKKLKSLRLFAFNFSDSGLTLAALLKATPQLERLHLPAASFDPHSNRDSLPALQQSRLREISIDTCFLKLLPKVPREQRLHQTRLQHHGLREGLSQAPCLHVLNIRHEHEDRGSLSGSLGVAIFLEGFVNNPQATTLCVDSRGDMDLANKLVEYNAERIKKGWSRIELVVESSRGQLRLHPEPAAGTQVRSWEDYLFPDGEDDEDEDDVTTTDAVSQ